jgi:ubiquinone/menaquinone biosynthesis C-methylase UbiE
MPTEQEVYQQHAEQYERLIQREDYQNHILRAVEQICPLKGMDVVDLGAGTGRLTRILAPHVGTIRAYDSSAHMLARAQSCLHAMGLSNWQAGDYVTFQNRKLVTGISQKTHCMETLKGWIITV